MKAQLRGITNQLQQIKQVAIAASTSLTQDYLNINVTNLVQDMVDNPSTSFGFLMRLQNESYYRRMGFASSDHSNNALHPKLVVYYSQTLSTSEMNNSDFEFNLFPNPTSDFMTVDLNNTRQKLVSIDIINSKGQNVYLMLSLG